MNKMWRYNRQLHRWVSYLLLLPISFWFISGVFMSWSTIEEVRGEHNRAKAASVTVSSSDLARILPNDTQIKHIMPRMVGSVPAALVTTDSGDRLLRLSDGSDLAPLTEEMARAVAEADFKPDADILSADYLIESAPIDYRGPLPVWRIAFDHDEGTVLYVDPVKGRVLARRSDHWRVFDFLWMLHIQDFDERDDINNPLLMISSALAVLFLITGLLLVIQHLKLSAKRRKKRWNFK